ncbi:MAG: hypothetical protein RLY31_2509 [Bacteroidota bacterium]
MLVDKPAGWTSFDVVNKIRGVLRHCYGVSKIKVGHAGTLDPMATGLLIICTGKLTKRITDYQEMEKEYTGTIRLGATTPSYDAETEPDGIFSTEHITEVAVEHVRQQFVGPMDQLPPVFSAIKVDGQPMYKKARAGERPSVQARPVTIYDLRFTRVELPEIDFEVRCSKGTYIRSLAYDIGKALDSGAYLSRLRRTAIGRFRVSDAWQLDRLVDHLEQQLHTPGTD